MCRSADVSAVKSLLAALKQSVESYLGTNICFAGLVLDDHESTKAGVAEEALRALGLRQVRGTWKLPAKAVISTYKPDNYPGFDEEPWLVLAVDYSSTWFNIGLYTIDEGFVFYIDGFVKNPTIVGKDSNKLDAIEDAIRHLFANPPENVTLPEKIDHLVVYGDEKKEDVLSLLKRIVGADLVERAIVSQSIFDAVSGLAGGVYADTHNFDWFMHVAEPAIGCRWRMLLNQKERDEL
jgi:hypothetical protein